MPAMAIAMPRWAALAYVALLLCSLVAGQWNIDPNAVRPRPPGFRGNGQPRVGESRRPAQPAAQRPANRPANRPQQARCTEFKIRREWRTLSKQEQLNYLAALRCMTKLPTKAARVMKPPGLVSRYDDFVFTHITLADKVHYVGQFLPWHRYFLNLFEEALRNDCGYQGTQPYWDWNLDTADFSQSPIFDPVFGLGGNGMFKPLPAGFTVNKKREHMKRWIKTQEDLAKRDEEKLSKRDTAATAESDATSDDPWAKPKKPKKQPSPVQAEIPAMAKPTIDTSVNMPNNWREQPKTDQSPTDRTHTGGGCVMTGIFGQPSLNVTLGIGDTLENNNRCLVRDFMPQFAAQSASTKNIREVLSQPNYGAMFSSIDTLHEAGHGGVGGYLGDMANLYSSNVDPIFYFHHANLDRFWWSWQALDLRRRLYDISGPSTYHGPVNVSLSFPLLMGESGRQVTIRDVMDTRSSPWCVAYDRVYTL